MQPSTDKEDKLMGKKKKESDTKTHNYTLDLDNQQTTTDNLQLHYYKK